jgi:3-oxoacyl-[acyl-carrier-protein] synthase-3
MRGGDVYRHAVVRMTEASTEVLERAGLTVADVDLVVAHQANRRILEAVAQRLGVPDDRCHLTVQDHGNTSAASIPLALEDARARGRLVGGERVLLTAFGAGLTWAACLVRWSGPDDGAAVRA